MIIPLVIFMEEELLASSLQKYIQLFHAVHV